MLLMMKIFCIAFIPALIMFLKLEFKVNPHIGTKSQRHLLPSIEGRPSQVVLLIVDALRLDYVPRMEFIRSFKDQYPLSTFLARSVVGNPTMTTQRIESLMTGS